MQISDIRLLADLYYKQVVLYRRYFHQHPELSGNEKNTADYICHFLDELHIPYQKNVAGYGVIAIIKGELSGGKTVALRADMDALPIQEKSNKEYCSTVPGVMHACGHDVHTASLMGTILILNHLKNQFGGCVKAIFQPSEEEYEGGAKFMIQAGALSNPEVDVIIAQHVTHGMETGTIGIKANQFMASTDELYFTVHGKGGHAALPLEAINPIEVGFDIINSLSKTIRQQQPENIPTVLAFGKFVANGLTNLIPDEAEIAGTFRTFDEEWRKNALTIITNTANQIAKNWNAHCDVVIRNGYPALINNPEVTQRIAHYAGDYLGNNNVIDLPYRMTAEDFAFFLQEKKGCFYRLGTSNQQKNITQHLHTNQFDIDEEALRYSIGLMSWIAINELSL